MHLARTLGPFPLLAALAATPACAVRAYPPTIGGYATVYTDDVPPNIYAYPHTSYEGGYAYLVGDRWYYPRGDRWVVLQGEPAELYRYRSDYVRRGPATYPGPRREYTPRQSAPPAYGYPPPAVRVQ